MLEEVIAEKSKMAVHIGITSSASSLKKCDIV
jgi:hypothetical protein